ncbi:MULTISPECIES: NAD(P)H-hydrate dehydratase [Maribacter]|uniref:Bifunctional NAD(P)H-hydrate repair enzyme n=1 Tax=Maribacter flavus TaxID=1658664 RepID=A0ABU7IMV0_9FLAO|nr:MULTISPECIES: NAD(P)H-hydrate dehydratase [Maribacter]MDC6407057.1 NAD(P)H-hydrate dehydratase [Maribacter sp. PR66]MEE1974158.1 NAD(P)H-hydrate dehydratase [Maribacter flavus]
MKVFTAAQIYKADTFTIEKQQITSDALMERAATQIFNWMHVRMQGAPVKIHLFCGIGNNGGDGIALARHLFEHGYDIAVYVVKYSDKRSKDFLTNLDRLKDRKIWPIYMDADSNMPEIHPNDIIVDAIFGIGLNRTPDAWVAKIIQHLNTSKAFILSVDIPSGLFTDSVPEDKEAVIRANYVLSFQVPKLVFFLPETGIYVEQWEVLDIGLDAEFLMNEKTDFELISKNEVLQFYRPRTKYSHKGTYGHALIVGGSYGKMGAVILTSRAALKAGSGLVTAYVPECGYGILQTAIPEVMVLTNGKEAIEAIEFDMKPTVVGLGIGMGIHDKTVKALEHFLKANKLPLILDADALNILSKNQDLMDFIPENSILTPHPMELERLVGKWKDDFEKLEKVRQFTDKRKVVLVVKGAHSITFFEGRGYINTTGNPGMATAGSGDALTGIITGLIAQGYSSLQAAIFGVYIHGKSGDISVENTGYQALIASDIIEGIGSAFLDLFRVPEQERPDTPEKES